MGNKAVRPQPNKPTEILSVAHTVQEPFVSANKELIPIINKKRSHAKPKFRCADRRKSQHRPTDIQILSKQTTPINYNTSQTLSSYVQPGHVLPMGAQRPHTSNRRKPNRTQRNINNQINSSGSRINATSQELLSYPFGRAKCRSEMGDLPSSVYNPAQLYRLTDTTDTQTRIGQSQTRVTTDTPRPATARSRPMSKSLVVNSPLMTSPSNLSHTQITPRAQSNIFEVVPSLKPIAELLQEFNRQCLLLPDALKHAMDDLLDYNMFLRAKENGVRQREIVVASIQSSLTLLSELIPLMSQHILNAQDLFQALHRMEEKFQTFQKLVEQLSLWNEPRTQNAHTPGDHKTSIKP